MSGDIYSPSKTMGPATCGLVVLTTIAVATACFVAACVMAGKVSRELAAAGFVPWSGPSILPVLSDLMSINDNRAWPIEAIWMEFVPGQKLAFAFTESPMVWACLAGTGSLAAGVLALLAAMK